MIQSIKHKGIKRLWEKDDKSKLPANDIDTIEQILTILDNIEDVEEANIYGFDFHELQGNRKGDYSMAVRNNWKITFRFDKENRNVFNVNYEDYH